MQNAIAFSDNDVIVVAWSYGQRLDGCMGFAVYRIDAKGVETPLPSMAVFPGFTPKPGQTTASFPVQKFYWKDPYARLVAEKTGSRTFRYKIVPLEGPPGSLKPMAAIAFAISNEVEISAQVAAHYSAFFNRGLISTQRVSKALGGNPTKAKLLAEIGKKGSALRTSLAADMLGALLDFTRRAKAGGTLHAALYELTDDELVTALEGAGKKLHLILSNPGGADAQSGGTSADENADSRKRLAATAGELINRMLPNGQIGHNKFVVHTDASGHPAAVLFGSTNWTATGMCAQTNNTIVSTDKALAARYLAYWKQLAADTKAAGADPKALQGTTLRTWDTTSKTLAIDDGAKAVSWFSPNTPKLRSGSVAKEKRPPDMEDVAQLVAAAKQAVLFLVFYPGSPSIADWAGLAQKANKDLFVRGCVTNPSAAEAFYYELHGTGSSKKQDPRVIQAMALSETLPAGWSKEILNAGFAVTHDKIVVIDPFSPSCVVVTGSHNLGHRASFNNDENLVIVKGKRALAAAYATHVLDVYDHFSWRWIVQTQGLKQADAMLEVDPVAWQSRYFDASGNIVAAQLKFWLAALPAPAPAAYPARRSTAR